MILAVWKLGSAVPAILRISQDDVKGNANISFGDGAFSAQITEGTVMTWQGQISFLSLVLLVGLPPLVLWALWLRGRQRPEAPEMIGEGSPDAIGDRARAHDTDRRS